MFAFSPESRPFRQRPAVPAGLRQKVAPLIAASARTLPVDPALSGMLPGKSLQRGTVTLVAGRSGFGATSLGIALLAHASSNGHWCGVVGLRHPGVLAMKELGLDVDRVIFVPEPDNKWAEAAAELFDGVELLLVAPPHRVPHGTARQLIARAKERHVVMLVVLEHAEHWPIVPEFTLSLVSSSWQGVGRGDGRLAARRVGVVGQGRRGASHARQSTLWLPSLSGAVGLIEEQAS